MRKPKLHLHLLSLIKKLEKDVSWHRLDRNSIFPQLIASDNILMNAYQAASNQAVTDLDTHGGTIELGPFLYFMNHPPEDLLELNAEVVVAMELAEGRKLPKSQFTPDSFEAMTQLAKAQGVLGPGGEIYGTGKYEQFDAGWIFSLFMFAIYELGIKKHHAFGKTPVIINAPADKPIRIAVVGDWGTGKFGEHGGPALAVIKGLQNLQPDYVIHLGDVYYAGTDDEENDNLLKFWPETLGSDRSFTLNSNHEMYDGTNGYFKRALKQGGPFSAQQQTSYFAIRRGEWLLLGLDSAYYSDPGKLFMNGTINGSDGEQANWIKNNFLDQDPDKIIIFTHHTPVNLAGDKLKDFNKNDDMWNEVKTALGGKAPGTWYFGHTHNAAVYSESSAIGKAGCKGRLVGHGAIPYGESVTLKESLDTGLVEYFANTHLDTDPIRVRNGFSILEFGSDGKMTEQFYEIADGADHAQLVWQKPAPA